MPRARKMTKEQVFEKIMSVRKTCVFDTNYFFFIIQDNNTKLLKLITNFIHDIYAVTYATHYPILGVNAFFFFTFSVNVRITLI